MSYNREDGGENVTFEIIFVTRLQDYDLENYKKFIKIRTRFKQLLFVVF